MIFFLFKIYDNIAKKLTKWENYRTYSEYENQLVYKLFAFQFVNNYASLFYVAFLRNVIYTNGIFNLGPDYQDSCDQNNCMALLSIQVLVFMIVTPFPSFFLTVLLP